MKAPIALCAILTAFASGEEKRAERWYQERIAAKLNGKMEVPVENGRADLVTATHAIEVERASKWKNAIGQSLWYGFQLNKKPGIVLVGEDREEIRKAALRLESVLAANKIQIQVWRWPDDF